VKKSESLKAFRNHKVYFVFKILIQAALEHVVLAAIHFCLKKINLVEE